MKTKITQQMIEILPKDLLVNYFLVRLPSNSLIALSQTNRYFSKLIFNDVLKKITMILQKKYGRRICEPKLESYCEQCRCFDPLYYDYNHSHPETKKHRSCFVCTSPLLFPYMAL